MRKIALLSALSSCAGPDLKPEPTLVETGPEISIQERLLETLPPDAWPSISPTGNHWGYTLGGQAVLDSQPGEKYDRVSGLHFSDDGDRWAYHATLGNRCYLAGSGRKVECPGGPGFPHINSNFDVLLRKIPYLIPHGQRKYSVRIDGVESRIWDALSHVMHDENRTRTAYFGRIGNQVYPVIDGIEGEPFEKPRNPNIRPGLGILLPSEGFGTVYEAPTVSRDGKHVGYIAPEDGLCRMVIDGIKGPPLKGVAGPYFSEDGKRIGSFEIHDGKWRAVVDGVVDLRFQVDFDLAQFSRNLDHVVGIEKREERKRVVVDGKCGPWFRDVGQFTLSPNGLHTAYLSTDSEIAQYMKGVLCSGFVVWNGQRGREYEGVYHPTFSPNSRRLAYVAKRGTNRFVVCDRNEIGPYEEVRWPIFSPDSRHLCFEAEREGKHLLVVDGRDSEPVDQIIGTPRFSRDSKHVGYGALKGRELWWKVIAVP